MYFCFRVLYFQKYKKTITFSITFSMLGEPGLYFLYFLHYLGCVGWMKWRLRCSDVVLQKAPTISYNTKNCASCLFVFLEWLTNSPFTFDPFVAIAKLIIILVESWLVLSWFILVKLVFFVAIMNACDDHHSRLRSRLRSRFIAVASINFCCCPWVTSFFGTFNWLMCRCHCPKGLPPSSFDGSTQFENSNNKRYARKFFV